MQQHLIRKPLVTEKSLAQANGLTTFTFAVAVSATKQEIKQHVEQLFGVKVTSVNTVSNKRSLKRTGKRRQTVTQPKTKKALVTLQKGQTIDVFDTYKAE